MPKKKQQGSTKSFGDVTLNDFANTTVIKFRKKKSTSNLDSVLTEINEGEQTSWNEEEHQYEDDFIDEMVQNDETILSSDAQNIIYNVYPIDIWYIISDYIRQEDICRFALICKATLEVVSSVKFWTRLYQRYYSPRKKLPKDLQPEQVLGRKYGLRTGVIRALGFLNPKYEHNMSFCIVNLKKLKNRICDCLWHRQINKSQWCFLFKLREKITTHNYSRRNDKHPDSLEMLDDISANPDKHYKILKIFCEQFIHVPPVLGQTLTYVDTSSQGVLLRFGSGIQTSRQLDCSDTTSILFSAVDRYDIHDWWDPSYPRKELLMPDLLNSD